MRVLRSEAETMPQRYPGSSRKVSKRVSGGIAKGTEAEIALLGKEEGVALREKSAKQLVAHQRLQARGTSREDCQMDRAE
ncbi:MAG: hypothetical protein AAF400_01080 [Bacteroidota bacterium]